MVEIKISDLSIGDWVMFTPNKNICVAEPRFTSAPAKITGAYRGKEVFLEVECKREFMAIPLSCIEPIPLTHEILENNGFIDYEVGKGWYVLNVADDLRVWLHRNSHDWTFQLMKWSPLSTHEICKVFIKHTHQLQHALRFVGVEKEIEV